MGEAEYVSASESCKEIVSGVSLLLELGLEVKLPVKLKQDNKSAIAWINGQGKRQRVKHIDIAHHFIQELVADGVIEVIWISSGEILADIFTKPLGAQLFLKAR